MRKAGRVLSKIMAQLKRRLKAGIRTKEVDEIAGDLIKLHGAIAAFKGYRGFPANICISLNEEVVHGIPDDRQLNSGDIVSLDIGIKLNDFYADAAFTYPIGKVNGKLKKLVDTTKESLFVGINQARAGNHLSDISYAIQSYVESKGFSVVRDFVGHGIGRQMHEEPEVPNFGRPSSGPVLKEGMALAIEPMVNMGTWEVKVLDNGWTAATKDKKHSAHFEHTVVITDKGPEILTK
jgi:methionyl aminopeptidase